MSAPTYDLDRLLAQDEGQYFERKSLWEGPPGSKTLRDRREVRDEIAENVAGFANADGGTLVMGVENDGRITGHGYPDEAIQDFLAVPVRRLNPTQPPGIQATHRGHEILIFSTDAAPQAVMVTGDGFPRRCHDQVVHESEEAINAIKGRNRRERYEEEICPGVRVGDLDSGLIRRAAMAAGLGALPPDEYLMERRLADRRGEALVLRRGAVLLFAAGARTIDHPNAGLRIFRVNGTERLTGPRHNVQELPRTEAALPALIEQTHRTISGLIRTSARLHDLFFREMPEYPTFAWQETIINAVAHRDYRAQGSCVEVWLFEDRMEVRSPGGLLPEVELSRLQRRERVHVSRNPRIVRVLAELAMMREQGEGIPRIFEEMEQSYLPMPDLVADRHSFMIILRNTPIFDTGDTAWVEHVRNLPINARQRRVLAAFKGGRFASADYQRLNQVDRDTAYRDLREMIAKGLLEGPARPGRGAQYRVLVKAPKPQALFPREALAQVMEKEGAIKSVHYQRVFGVSRHQATEQLSALVDAGILCREGERRGARYLPGPAWQVGLGGAPSGK